MKDEFILTHHKHFLLGFCSAIAGVWKNIQEYHMESLLSVEMEEHVYSTTTLHC